MIGKKKKISVLSFKFCVFTHLQRTLFTTYKISITTEKQIEIHTNKQEVTENGHISPCKQRIFFLIHSITNSQWSTST